MGSPVLSSINVGLESLLAHHRELQDVVITNESRLAEMEATWGAAWKAACHDIGGLKHELYDLKSKLEMQNHQDAKSEQKVRITPAESRMEVRITPAESRADSEFKYTVEENLYGLVCTLPIGLGTVLTLLIFYTVAVGIIATINSNVAQSYYNNALSLDGFCNEDGNSWDCRPAGYVNLLAFASLDDDGNGEWSAEEAGQRDLLQQFQGLHNVVLNSPKLLELVAPSVREGRNLLCYWRYDPQAHPFNDYLYQLTISEVVAMAKASGFNCSAEMCVYLNCSLIRHAGSLRYFDASSRTSDVDYMLKTRLAMSLSRSTFQEIMKNIHLPCRLLEPKLCSNAESKGLLSAVPMWQELRPGNRIRACELFVVEQCPMVFGMGYAQLQGNFHQVCGDTELVPKYHQAPRMPSDLSLQNSCRDNDTLAKDLTIKLRQMNPVLEAAAIGFLRQEGQSNSTLGVSILGDIDCASLNLMHWCNDVTEVIVDIASHSPRAQISSLVGAVCPQTCCAAHAVSCPAHCLVQAGSTDQQELYLSSATYRICSPQVRNIFDWMDMPFGKIRCVGVMCTRIHVNNTSGMLTIALAGLSVQDAGKFVIHTDKALEVFVSKLDTGSFSFEGGVCNGAYMEILGTKYCKGNPPTHAITLPRTVGDIHEISFFNWDWSGDCTTGFSFTIKESAETSSQLVNTVKFSSALDSSVFISSIYLFFFFLVLYLWSAFILVEVSKACEMLIFVLSYPSMPGGTFKRAFIFLFVGVPRILLALWVFMVGCILVSVHPDFIDVVLNSVALTFILDLDDVMYSITVPSSIQKHISEMEPFRWGRRTWKSSFHTVLGVLIPAACATCVGSFQFFWAFGIRRMAEQFQCACHLQGSSCIDAVLGQSA